MAKKITKADISEADIFGFIKASAQQTIEVIQRLNKELIATSDSLKKSIGGTKFDSAKAVDNFVKSTEKANKLQLSAIKLEEQKAKATAQYNRAAQEEQKLMQQTEKTTQSKIKTDETLIRQKQRIAKEGERNKRVVEAEGNAYKQLEKKTRDLKNQSKTLGAEMLKLEQAGQKNTTKYRELARTYQTVTRAAKQGDSQLKKLDQTVGDNFRNVGNYVGGIKSLARGFAQLAGGLGFVRILKGAGDIVVKFDQAQGDLAAISGKTGAALSNLTKQAKELGATTQFSATEITNMQIELAKLGFSTENQIGKMTKGISNFAAATGADIPSAAALAGSALRAFGLDASEMDRVVSVLGVATTKSALDFQKLETGLSTIAPVANAFGFSIEDTTALLGQLANAGFDASSSATATRNILLNLADANGDLAKELGRPIKSADDLAAALQELDAKGVDLATTLELTDKRSVAAFNTFMKQSGGLVELRDSITDVNDELEDMAAKKLDTIGGQFTLLSSAWEGLILSMNEGSGIGEKVKSLLGFLAENLTEIANVIKKGVVAWLLYKSALIGTNAVTFIMNGGFKTMLANMAKQIPLTKAYRLEQIKLGRAAKQTGVAIQQTGKAMNAVPWMLVIALAVELATAIWDIASGNAEAERTMKSYAKAQADALKNVGKVTDFSDKNNQEGLARINRLKAEGRINDKQELEMKKDLYRASKDDVKLVKVRLRGIYNENKARREAIELELEAEAERTKGGSIKEGTKQIEDVHKVTRLREELEKVTQTQREAGITANLLATEEKVLDDIIVDLDNELITNAVALRNSRKETAKSTKEQKEANSEFKAAIDLLELYNSLMQDRRGLENDIDQILRNRVVVGMEDAVAEEMQVQKNSAEATGEIDVDLLENLINRKSELKKEAIISDRDFEMRAVETAYNEKTAAQRLALEEERKNLIEGANGDATVLAKIEANYQEELVKQNFKEVEGKKNMKLEMEKIALESGVEVVSINRETAVEIKAVNDELINDQIAYGQAQIQNTQNVADAKREAEQKMWNDLKDMAQVATDYLTALADKRIAKIDEEIAKATTQADNLRALAENGNIDAKESLAAQQQIIDEANRKKMAEEKRKQAIEFANTVFQTYAGNVEKGVANPLAATIRDVSLLQSFIATFVPSHKDGTEDTGGGGMGLDGQGGFAAILHPNERVMTKEQNKKVGGMNNNALAQLAQEYQNGSLTAREGGTMASGMESEAVIRQLQQLEQTIKNKPEHTLGVEDVLRDSFTWLAKTKSGNTSIYNRYRVKK